MDLIDVLINPIKWSLPPWVYCNHCEEEIEIMGHPLDEGAESVCPKCNWILTLEEYDSFDGRHPCWGWSAKFLPENK